MGSVTLETMDVKLTVFIVLVALGFLVDFTSADFYYNRPSPKVEDLGILKLKCIPGRTVMKVEEKDTEINTVDSDSEEFTRRKYSEADAEERCFICVCSADGKNEYCFKRAALNVNECMIISTSVRQLENGLEFDHQRSLSHRIRRDYLWHNDEIPYDPASKCYRGHSYYTNHDTPNDTDINYNEEDMISLLDYSSNTSCHYCVCSVSGNEAGCIKRSVWFCNYLKYLRTNTNAARDMYTDMFKQDRPTYFRQLSWRMRRTMDSSLFNLIEHGGDTLCCSHPDGHRRQLHNGVHDKLRTLKRRFPKENLLGGAMRGDYVDFIVNND